MSMLAVCKLATQASLSLPTLFLVIVELVLASIRARPATPHSISLWARKRGDHDALSKLYSKRNGCPRPYQAQC